MLKGLKGIKKIHFVGIGGAGMSPLAKILVELGYEVSGSDRAESHITDHLKELGARIYVGQDGEHVRGVDAIVVSTAIPFDNPEVLAAGQLGIPKLHRSDINAALVNEYKGIAVAGAHGKTTTTSMIGVALDRLEVSPTIIVGGEVGDLGTNAKLGKSDYLVSEADESDGSFLKLKPHIAVVTNVENDHMDHYGTMDNIRAAFQQFIENVDKETGYAVLCYESEELRNIAKKIDRKIYSYGIDVPADYQAANIGAEGSGISFDVMHEGKNLGHVTLNIPGRHNVLNAMAAIVTGLSWQKGWRLFMGRSAVSRPRAVRRASGCWMTMPIIPRKSIPPLRRQSRRIQSGSSVSSSPTAIPGRSSCTRSSGRPSVRRTCWCSRTSTRQGKPPLRESTGRQSWRKWWSRPARR